MPILTLIFNLIVSSKPKPKQLTQTHNIATTPANAATAANPLLAPCAFPAPLSGMIVPAAVLALVADALIILAVIMLALDAEAADILEAALELAAEEAEADALILAEAEADTEAEEEATALLEIVNWGV